MSFQTAKNANEFIEQQLDERAHDLSQEFPSDVLFLAGPILVGVDDLVRDIVEDIKRRPSGNTHDTLTVLLSTLGGYIETAHRIVDTLRHHYKYVNFIVPNYAYSAGTILALSGDAIYMDYFSRLGPIDPQVETDKGRPVPALGYLIQWERLLKKAKAGKITMPEVQLMIEGFDQAELYKYEQARELSITLLKEWLVKYKFKNWAKTETRKKAVTPLMKSKRAAMIAKELNKTDQWHVHGYGISMYVLRKDLKLKIVDYGENQTLDRKIKLYDGLLQDYMAKRGNAGVIHAEGIYQPYS